MSRPRLLLIDDEPALATFIADVARLQGIEAVETDRHERFTGEFDDQRPDMVALDLGMPNVDGVELLRFLADRGFDGPVMIVSGFDRRVLESAFRLGAEMGLNMVGPLEKPARLDSVEALLRENLPSAAP